MTFIRIIFTFFPGGSIGSASGLVMAQQLYQHQHQHRQHHHHCTPASTARARALQAAPCSSSSRDQLLDDDTPSPPMIITAGAPLMMPIQGKIYWFLLNKTFILRIFNFKLER